MFWEFHVNSESSEGIRYQYIKNLKLLKNYIKNQKNS